MITSSDRRVVARFGNSPTNAEFVQGTPGDSGDPLLDLGWASALFAALSLRLEFDVSQSPTEDMLESIKTAKSCAGIDHPEWVLSTNPTASQLNWNEEINEWKDANFGLGVINSQAIVQ